MADNASVRMYTKHVKVTIANATEEALKKVAFQIEGVTKRNIQGNDQIDTGFMMNSVYAVFEDGSNYDQTWKPGVYPVSPRKHGGQEGEASRKRAPERKLERNFDAGVIVGAEYAIFQELRKPFLFPAAEEVGRYASGIVERVYQERVHD